MNYIVTKNKDFFSKIDSYSYCGLEEMILTNLIAVDTETSSLSPREGRIFSIQIGTGKDNYLIDLQQYKDESLCLSLEEVMPYFFDKTMIFHNAAFDLGFFFSGGYWIKNVYDTMLASMILYNGDKTKQNSFQSCMSRELGLYYKKDERKNISTIQLSTKSAIEYCFNDVDKLLTLHHKYIELLTKRGQMETYNLHCKHIRALAYMELCGMPISAEKWKAKMDFDFSEYKKAEEIVKDYIWENLPQYRDGQYNMFDTSKRLTCLLSSPSQMVGVFKSLGINVEVVIKNVVKESIEQSVISKSTHPFVKLWVNFKDHEHNVTTFGNSIYNKISEGRVYTRFNPMVDTARIASRRGEINFLNFPATKETRECFVANDGFRLIVADYEGQETVVGADITGDEAMIKSVVEGADLHCAFARVLFPEIAELSDDEIKTAHKDKRNASKAPRFCFQFGGTGFTLAQNEGMSLAEGDRIEKLFKKLHSGIYAYGKEKLKESIKNGYIGYAYGFKLILPNLSFFTPLHEYVENVPAHFWDSYRIGKKEYDNDNAAKKAGDIYRINDYPSYNLYKENKAKISKYFSMSGEYMRLCLNAPTQGTAAHQTKLATIMLFDEIEKNRHYWKVRIANVIHDEIVMEVQEDLAEQYVPILENSMKEGGNKFLTNPILKMSVTANIGNNWYEAK